MCGLFLQFLDLTLESRCLLIPCCSDIVPSPHPSASLVTLYLDLFFGLGSQENPNSSFDEEKHHDSLLVRMMLAT